MAHKGRIQRPRQVLGATATRNVTVGRVVSEEVGLGLESLVHWLVPLDVLLRPVYHTNEAQLEGVHTAGEYVQCVCAMVHEVDLGEDADGPSPERVDMSCELEGFRVDDVDVRRGDGEDDAVRFRDVLRDEISGLLLDVGRLVADGDLDKDTISRTDNR